MDGLYWWNGTGGNGLLIRRTGREWFTFSLNPVGTGREWNQWNGKGQDWFSFPFPCPSLVSSQRRYYCLIIASLMCKWDMLIVYWPVVGLRSHIFPSLSRLWHARHCFSFIPITSPHSLTVSALPWEVRKKSSVTVFSSTFFRIKYLDYHWIKRYDTIR